MYKSNMVDGQNAWNLTLHYVSILCMHYVVYKHAYVAKFGYDFWSLNRRDFNPLKHEFLKP